jgi:hypothetical protein
VGAKAINRDEIPKMAAAIRSPGLLPFLSAILPAVIHPIMAPKARLPVANPSQYSLSPNFICKKGSAPEITAKSKPNKYPPKAEIKERARIYPELYEWRLLVMTKIVLDWQSCF